MNPIIELHRSFFRCSPTPTARVYSSDIFEYVILKSISSNIPSKQTNFPTNPFDNTLSDTCVNLHTTLTVISAVRLTPKLFILYDSNKCCLNQFCYLKSFDSFFLAVFCGNVCTVPHLTNEKMTLWRETSIT